VKQSNEIDLIDAVSDPSFFKNKKEKALGEIAEVIHSAFSTDSGKRALNILSLTFYAHKSTPPKDSLELAVRHGEKNVMQFIYDQMGKHNGKS
jgi:hypothetical protein